MQTSPSIPVPLPFLSEHDERIALAATTAGAMAIVVTSDGLVLHLRDNKPTIPHPNRWSLFGGAVDEGESPEQTMRRELYEELALADVSLRPLWRLVDDDGDGRMLTIFEAGTVHRAGELRLAEGQALDVFDIPTTLGLRLATFCRRSLLRYSELISQPSRR